MIIKTHEGWQETRGVEPVYKGFSGFYRGKKGSKSDREFMMSIPFTTKKPKTGEIYELPILGGKWKKNKVKLARIL